jgi:hypothetical protein
MVASTLSSDRGGLRPHSYDSRLPDSRQQMLSSSAVALQRLLSPRNVGDHSAFLAWDEVIRSYFFSNDLSPLPGGAPTLDELAASFAAARMEVSASTLQDSFFLVMTKYQEANTRFFYIVRNSLDLAGPMCDADHRMFANSNYTVGQNRDGMCSMLGVVTSRALRSGFTALAVSPCSGGSYVMLLGALHR